jgi:hypothetical protein
LGFFVFDVLSDHFCVEADGIYAVPSHPEVITPIGLLLQLAKLFNTRIAVRPLMVPTYSEIDNFGGTIPSKWI